MNVTIKRGAATLLFPPLFLVVVAASALLGAESANAQSQYDDTIQTTDSLVLQATGCEPVDYSINWSTALWQDVDNWTSDPGKYNDAQNNQSNAEHWYVSYLDYEAIGSDPTNNSIRIFYSTDPNTNATFDDTIYGQNALLMNVNAGYTWSTATFYMRSGDCKIMLSGAENGYGVAQYPYPIATEDGFNQPFIVWVNEIIYPSGYQGIIPPETYTPPINAIEVDYRINFTYTNSNSTLTAKYINKVTEPVSSLPDPKSVWWQLRDRNEPDSSAYEASIVCEANLPIAVAFDISTHCENENVEIDVTHSYFLVGKINPLSPLNEDLFTSDQYDITFKDTWFKIDFSKNSYGTTESCEFGALGGQFNGLNCIRPETADLTQCFTESFPFIDIIECIDSLSVLVNLLSFKTIEFGNYYDYRPYCHTMVVLDDWLGSPNAVLCPQFSDQIRMVVTPFVTLLFGLITVTFLTRKEGSI